MSIGNTNEDIIARNLMRNKGKRQSQVRNNERISRHSSRNSHHSQRSKKSKRNSYRGNIEGNPQSERSPSKRRRVTENNE